MISTAELVLAQADAGLPRPEFNAVPAWQWAIWFSELAPLCPSRKDLPVERRRANALNLEIGAPAARCSERSPDGRGLAWALSGGSWLAYGCCQAGECPRARKER